jgi:RNA polymerase sigma-70 factor (ECF subfamily)
VIECAEDAGRAAGREDRRVERNGATGWTETFEANRAHLTAVAYRMLGSWAEAEDAVQEAWLRFARADSAEIRDAKAWLTTVVARICLDVLRSARVRREAYVGPWLPEPLVERLSTPSDPAHDDPAEAASRHEQVGLALLVVLERLSPEQRVAFVMHDVFGLPFDQVASALSTTSEAARQLASRGRRAVAAEPAAAPARRRPGLAEQRRIVTAFLAATRGGDLEQLLTLLAPDAVMIGDGGGIAPAARQPVVGTLAVARFASGLFRRIDAEAEIDMEFVLVNGDLGIVMEVRALAGRSLPAPASFDRDRASAVLVDGDTVRFVMAFAFADDGRIATIYDQLNPHKLAGVPRLRDLRPASASRPASAGPSTSGAP